MTNPLLTAPKQPLLLSEKPRPSEIKPASFFAYPRDFLENRFVYLTLSPRARGLSIGINVNPDRFCNFDCVYCEVNRDLPVTDKILDCDAAAAELEHILTLIHSGGLKHLPPYSSLPAELLTLRHVALSGDGEPTISPQFREAVEMAVHIRARGSFPFYKIVLITNATGLDDPAVQDALNLFTPRDEIWAKLDAGTQKFFELVHQSDIPLQKILSNILLTARRRPVIIQSLFCQIDGAIPSPAEIEQFALRLRELREQGAQIPLVQIYSATRPTPHSNIRHLPLKTLSDIAETVRRIAGLKAEPF